MDWRNESVWIGSTGKIEEKLEKKAENWDMQVRKFQNQISNLINEGSKKILMNVFSRPIFFFLRNTKVIYVCDFTYNNHIQAHLSF